MKPHRETVHVVLDSEAVSALLGRTARRKHDTVLEVLRGVRGRRIVPTAVRVEAGWRRADPSAVGINQRVRDDDELDREAAERAVELRRAVPAASVVDVSVIVAAERAASGAAVAVLTSDLDDMHALAAHATVPIEVVPL